MAAPPYIDPGPVELPPAAPRRRLRFSLTPLADVMFQLLIFFMLSTSLAPYALIPLGGGGGGVSAPEIRAPGAPPPEIWQLSRGHVRVAGQTVPVAETAALAEAVRVNGVPEVILLASAQAHVQDVATVLEILRAARVAKVRLIGRAER